MTGPQGAPVARIASTGAVLDDRRLGSLMAAAQDGDRPAYGRLLAEIAARATEACTQGVWMQQMEAEDVEAFACGILRTVHAARATFDPRRSFDVWLTAIISTHLARLRREKFQRKFRKLRDSGNSGTGNSETLYVFDAGHRVDWR